MGEKGAWGLEKCFLPSSAFPLSVPIRPLMYLFIYLIYLFSVIAGKGNNTEGYLATLHKRKKKPCVLLSRP